VKGVTYATLNVQGSCNNTCGDSFDLTEYAARNAADIAWLKDTFAKAKADGSAGVMLISQADPGFEEFLKALRAEVISFGRPVVYVHGDTHYFRVDKPFLAADGKRLENFTRVETFGDNAATGTTDVHWVKALVDPKSRDVFAFQAQIVPGN